MANTPWRSYVNRAKAAFSADYRRQLGHVEAPTLILTPGHDVLIGETAATVVRAGLPDASEIVLDRTGHMFRFTHPVRYSQAIEDFLTGAVDRRRASGLPALSMVE